MDLPCSTFLLIDFSKLQSFQLVFKQNFGNQTTEDLEVLVEADMDGAKTPEMTPKWLGSSGRSLGEVNSPDGEVNWCDGHEESPGCLKIIVHKWFFFDSIPQDWQGRIE